MTDYDAYEIWDAAFGPPEPGCGLFVLGYLVGFFFGASIVGLIVWGLT